MILSTIRTIAVMALGGLPVVAVFYLGEGLAALGVMQ